ncbi:hypothetical protein [Fodinicola acaciae]|uniref:hypothetical protein n=1 Tax=Fodinicola acaciae TaxID=2681555 RepID=UPI0013CFC1F1|nr:hypothetical protein [Fodinicola acaciae]
MSDDQRWTLARDLLHGDGHQVDDRVAGLLVLLFGQRPHQITRLTVDHLTLGQPATLTLGASPIEIPEPFAGHLRRLVDQRHNRTTAGGTDPGPWLFPGVWPGRPILPLTMTTRLQRLGIQPSDYRASALLHLAGTLPPAVTADLLGLTPLTAHRWSVLAGRPWATYVADRLDQQHN